MDWSSKVRHEEYNGWTNWETWNTNLWMDEGVGGGSDYWAERAADIVGAIVKDEMGDEVEGGMFSISIEGLHEANYKLGTEMQASVVDALYEGTAVVKGLAGDLLQSAVDEINWSEIASHYVEAIAEHKAVVAEASDLIIVSGPDKETEDRIKQALVAKLKEEA